MGWKSGGKCLALCLSPCLRTTHTPAGGTWHTACATDAPILDNCLWYWDRTEALRWGELCPLRFSSAISAFHLLPPAATSYSAYSAALQHIAQQHHADLFIPVSGAGSSVEDSLAADEMYAITGGRCRTFIQDPETMRDLHDKDRFMGLVERLGMKIPQGRMVRSVSEAMEFLLEGDEGGGGIRKPRYVLKCMGLDENRGDMTLFPLRGDTAALDRTRERLEALKLGISQDCPYVFQEFIKGQGESFKGLSDLPDTSTPKSSGPRAAR